MNTISNTITNTSTSIPNSMIVSKIKKGCFQNNLAILGKYELVLECKSLDLHHYSSLTCHKIMEMVAAERKLVAKQMAMEDTNGFFYPEIINIIFEYANFMSNEEEIRQNRRDQILLARELRLRLRLRTDQGEHAARSHCGMSDDAETLVQWFVNHKYTKICGVTVNELRSLHRRHLWQLYLHEAQKIFVLSQQPQDIILSEQMILLWFRYLHYKQFRKTKFQYKHKLFPNVDWIRCTFFQQVQILKAEYPSLFTNHLF